MRQILDKIITQILSKDISTRHAAEAIIALITNYQFKRAIMREKAPCIDQAMTWIETPQGQHFWDELNHEEERWIDGENITRDKFISIEKPYTFIINLRGDTQVRIDEITPDLLAEIQTELKRQVTKNKGKLKECESLQQVK